jgi:hypothetical protein
VRETVRKVRNFLKLLAVIASDVTIGVPFIWLLSVRAVLCTLISILYP